MTSFTLKVLVGMMLLSVPALASETYTVQHGNIESVNVTPTAYEFSLGSAIRANGVTSGGGKCLTFALSSSTDTMGAQQFQLMLTAFIAQTSNVDFVVDSTAGGSNALRCHVTSVSLHR